MRQIERTYTSGLRYTFCDHFLVALLVASVSAIFTLIPECIEQEVSTKRTQHELVELPLDELVAVHLVYLALALAHGALTTETTERSVQRPLANIFLDCGAGR